MSSVAQLEVEIVTGKGNIFKKIIKPLLFVYIKLFFNMMGQGELVSPKNYVSLHILVF